MLQPRTSLPELPPSCAQTQGEPLCPEQLGAAEIASNGQAGDLAVIQGLLLTDGLRKVPSPSWASVSRSEK